jgi:hypothetical protein
MMRAVMIYFGLFFQHSCLHVNGFMSIFGAAPLKRSRLLDPRSSLVKSWCDAHPSKESRSAAQMPERYMLWKSQSTAKNVKSLGVIEHNAFAKSQITHKRLLSDVLQQFTQNELGRTW